MNAKDIVRAIGEGTPLEFDQFSPELLDLAIKELQETIEETKADLRRHQDSKAYSELRERVLSISQQLLIDGKYLYGIPTFDGEIAEFHKMQREKCILEEQIVQLSEKRKIEALEVEFDSLAERCAGNLLNERPLDTVSMLQSLVDGINRGSILRFASR
jgi:hypothetical protein